MMTATATNLPTVLSTEQNALLAKYSNANDNKKIPMLYMSTNGENDEEGNQWAKPGEFVLSGRTDFHVKELEFRPLASFNQVIQYALVDGKTKAVARTTISSRNEPLLGSNGKDTLGRPSSAEIKTYDEAKARAVKSEYKWYNHLYGIIVINKEPVLVDYRYTGSKILTVGDAIKASTKDGNPLFTTKFKLKSVYDKKVDRFNLEVNILSTKESIADIINDLQEMEDSLLVHNKWITEQYNSNKFKVVSKPEEAIIESVIGCDDDEELNDELPF